MNSVVRTFCSDSMEEIRQHLLSKGLSWDGKEIEIKIPSEVENTSTNESVVEGELKMLADNSLTSPKESSPIQEGSLLVSDNSSISNSISVPPTKKSLTQTISTATTSTSKNLLFLVDGVFDPNPIVERITRQAAKFVTAEEEAKCRKLEISALKNRNTAGVIDKNEDEQSTDIEDVISMTDTISGLNSASSGTISDAPGILVGSEKMKINNEGDENSISTFYGNGDIVSGNNPFINSLRITPPNISERDSQMITYCNSPMIRGNSNRNPILSSVNPDLINCLNKMFSPQNGKNSGPPSARDLPLSNSPRSSLTDEGSNRTLNIDVSDEGSKFGPSSPSRSGQGSARLDFFHKSGSGSTIGSSKPSSPMNQAVYKGCKSKLLQVCIIFFFFCSSFHPLSLSFSSALLFTPFLFLLVLLSFSPSFSFFLFFSLLSLSFTFFLFTLTPLQICL